MKKIFLFLLLMTSIPVILTFGAGIFSDKVRLNQGGYSVESRPLGKEVLIEINGLYKSMDVEEYVLGILPGTIAADYDMETLKVQAILIRTNVLKEMQENNTSDAADLSYQYLTVEERIALWGDKNYEKYEDRFERAVVDTAGLIIKQEDSLIMALYHEVSIGKTASAKEVLGEDISYLQSVDSSRDVEAKNYMNLVVYTWDELKERIHISGQNSENNEDSSEQPDEQKISIEIEESTDNGFVKKLSVNGTAYTGEQAMEQFSLASMNFYVEEIEDGIRFVCLGKGNGMGVSQYGANRMALDGKKKEEIIKYYYKDVSVSSFITQISSK